MTWLRKFLLPVLIGIGIVLLIARGVGAIYEKGYEAGKLDGAVAMLNASLDAERERNAALERARKAEQRIAEIERDVERRIAEARAQGRAHVETVERVIHERPDFAAVTRPAELERVRAAQLRDIAAAARRSADLSAAGLRGLRGPDRDERQPGRD